MTLKEELLNELPGYETQSKLAPGHSRIPSSKTAKQNAAVGLIVLAGREKTEIIFTKRATYDGHHSGQVSFPGGKEENLDSSLIETAIRETSEEISYQMLDRFVEVGGNFIDTADVYGQGVSEDAGVG